MSQMNGKQAKNKSKKSIIHKRIDKNGWALNERIACEMYEIQNGNSRTGTFDSRTLRLNHFYRNADECYA